MKKFVHMWYSSVFSNTSRNLWRKGEWKELWIHICDRKREKQTLVIDVNSDQHSNVYLGVLRSPCLQERKSTEQTSWRNVVFETSWKDWRRRHGKVANLSLFLPNLSGPLGTNPGSGDGEFCMENNSVPGLFGNVAVEISIREAKCRIDRIGEGKSHEGRKESENNVIHRERFKSNRRQSEEIPDAQIPCTFPWTAHKSTIDHS